MISRDDNPNNELSEFLDNQKELVLICRKVAEDMAASTIPLTDEQHQENMNAYHQRLRDEFAMAAMNGIQSNSAVEYNPKDMAERAYWIADEMLKARGVQ